MTGFLLTLLRLSLLGSVLGVVLMGVLRLLGRRISRAAGYYLWLLVLLRLCVPVWVDLPVPVHPSSTTVIGVTMTEPAGGQTGGTTPLFPPAGQGGQSQNPGGGPLVPDGGGETVAAAPAVDWKDVLTSPALWFMVWVLGFVLTLGRYGRSYRRFARLVRRGSHAPGQLALEVLKELDSGGKITLAVCPAIPCPMALGLLRPTIFLPDGVEDRGRLEDILRHELTHLRRRDLLYKWCAAVVTSLHWFNPLMPAFRREMARRCELACDEAAAGVLSDPERRRYGETLLSLAAEPPKGLVVTTLCEEKKHLQERLVDLVKGTKRGPAALALTLCAALLLGGCSMIGGAAMVTPGTEASAPAETPAASPSAMPQAAADPEALLADPFLYELGEGLTLAVPADLKDDLVAVIPEEDAAPRFPAVYYRPSYEASMADDGSPSGFLFAIRRYDQVGYEQEYLTATRSGLSQTVFAMDNIWYYVLETSANMEYHADGDVIDTSVPDSQRWEYVLSRIPDIQADFITRNGLSPYDREANLGNSFLWNGAHRYVEVRSDDNSIDQSLLLSQPVTQGSSGIWCVEGCFDNHYGGWTTELPRGIEVTAREYYTDLQTQVDAGHRPGLLDPVQVAQEWYQERYGTDTPEDVTFTLLEGEPAGKGVWNRISRVGVRPGFLENITLPGEDGADGMPMDGLGIALYSFLWLKVQPPETLEGEAIRYRVEGGDEILCLAQGDLVGVTIGDTVSWYRPAYPYEYGPYDRLLDRLREARLNTV